MSALQYKKSKETPPTLLLLLHSLVGTDTQRSNGKLDVVAQACNPSTWEV